MTGAPAAVWRDTFVAVALVSAVPLAAMAAFAARERLVRRLASALVCFAVGALLGAAFFHLIPDAYEGARDAAARRLVPATVLAGYATFLALEWALHGAHGHHDPGRAGHAHGHGHGHAHGRGHAHGHVRPAGARRRTLVTLNLVGDALHNLIDGVLIAATFLANPAAGVFTTVAVGLHEVPRELGSFGVFVHGGVAARRAVLYNVGTALVSFAGAALTLAVGGRLQGAARALLPFAAGNFLYIAASLLVPLLRRPGPARARLARAGLVALGLAATGASALVR